MRPTSVTVGSQAASAWIPLNSRKPYFATSLFVTLTPSASLTYSVQHGVPTNTHSLVAISGNRAGVLSKLTRSTTTATLVWPDHGMTTSDSIVVEGAGGTMDGTYAIASVADANTLTYTVTNSGITTALPGYRVLLVRVFDHDTLASKTASDDGNYAFPVQMCRLNVSTYSSGKATMTVVSG